MKRDSSTDHVPDYDSANSISERTAIPTPEHVDSMDERKTIDIEKAIGEHKYVLSATTEIPEGDLKGWLTVVGA